MGILAIPHTENDWIIEMLIVVGILPLLVALSAGAKVSGTFAKISTFIGNLSYPLYMLHYWIIWIFAAYVNTTPDERTLHVIIGWSIVPITMSLSYFALKIYDEPLRKFLKRKLTKRV